MESCCQQQLKRCTSLCKLRANLLIVFELGQNPIDLISNISVCTHLQTGKETHAKQLGRLIMKHESDRRT